jgi:hypothetical protein
VDDEDWLWTTRHYQESSKDFWLVRYWGESRACIGASKLAPTLHPFYNNDEAAQTYVAQLAEQGDPLAIRAIRHVLVMRSRARG